MEISDLSLSQMVARLMEVVGGLGLTDTTVGYYSVVAQVNTRFTSALSSAHGSSGSPLASQLQKPDLGTFSTLAIIFTV